MELTVFVRINKSGEFNRGDLKRLQVVPGVITNVILPDAPRGQALVTKDDRFGYGLTPVLYDINTRPLTFHP